MNDKGAFYGDAVLKQRLLQSLIQDRRNDRFVQKGYLKIEGDSYKGCHLGCAVRAMKPEVSVAELIGDRHMSWHREFVELFGFPLDLVRLQEDIFESLPASKAILWSESIIDAVPVGADLTGIARQVLAIGRYTTAYFTLQAPEIATNLIKAVAAAPSVTGSVSGPVATSEPYIKEVELVK